MKIGNFFEFLSSTLFDGLLSDNLNPHLQLLLNGLDKGEVLFFLLKSGDVELSCCKWVTNQKL